MDRYEKIAAAEKIDGYYSPPMDREQVALSFDAAKSECAGHLRTALENVEKLTLSEFLSGRHGK